MTVVSSGQHHVVVLHLLLKLLLLEQLQLKQLVLALQLFILEGQLLLVLAAAFGRCLDGLLLLCSCYSCCSLGILRQQNLVYVNRLTGRLCLLRHKLHCWLRYHLLPLLRLLRFKRLLLRSSLLCSRQHASHTSLSQQRVHQPATAINNLTLWSGQQHWLLTGNATTQNKRV